MFHETIRELNRLKGTQKVSVSVETDAEGYFDRECPAEACGFLFKVHETDWTEKVCDDAVFCPFCGHTADADQWWTREQIAYVKEMAVAQISGRVSRALKHDADRWNRRQPRNALINISLKVEEGIRRVSIPAAAAEPMRMKVDCPACGCRYGFIGAAFFCPACGHNGADNVFGQSLDAIRRSLDALPSVRHAMPDRDTAETTTRFLVENGLQNAVTAFQRYVESLYESMPNAPNVRRNLFQNLQQGSDAWRKVTGHGYENHLDASETAELNKLFQQRHLLAHRQGLVDEDYVTRSGDTSYRPGQRLVIPEAAVRRCVDLVEQLAAGMARDAANLR